MYKWALYYKYIMVASFVFSVLSLSISLYLLSCRNDQDLIYYDIEDGEDVIEQEYDDESLSKDSKAL